MPEGGDNWHQVSSEMASTFFAQPGWKLGNFLGTNYHYLSIKSSIASHPVILLIHGFPSGPLTYQKVIPLLVEQGYGVIVPEMLGYGKTDRPTDIKRYEVKTIAAELAALLDQEGVDKVVVVGHDHGSLPAQRFTQYNPSRSLGLVSISVPYIAPEPFAIEPIHAALAPILGYENFGYWYFILEDPDAVKIVDEHLESFVSLLYPKDPADWKTQVCPRGALKERLLANQIGETASWFSDQDKDSLITYLAETGLAAPSTWYHAVASNVNDPDKELPNRIAVPYLFFASKKDAAVPPIFAAAQAAFCDDLTSKEFDVSHWLCEEEPAGFVTEVVAWLKSKGI